MSPWTGNIKKVDDFRWIIPKSSRHGMLVDGMVYATEELMSVIRNDESLEQVANVAFLPGIVGRSMAMPDIHWGYGFPIGGVAATLAEGGVVSPGGVGFDINCGVRMLRSDLTEKEVRPKIEELVNQMFLEVPSGVGSEGKIRISGGELAKVMKKGARWMVEQGIGWAEDIEVTEQGGQLSAADPAVVTDKAVKRGEPQLGTLGAGNHFLEIQVVDEIYDEKVAQIFGITQPGQITVMIHTGSRGFGHQVCEDSLGDMQRAIKKYDISVPDRQLACAPVNSPEGQKYMAAMSCAANYAWANRQAIVHWVRAAFEKVMGAGAHKLGMSQVYDVAHNIAKIEEHMVDGRMQKVCVHRKGATRAFGPGQPDITAKYRAVGQPVLIPGDMGRYSFLLVGTEKSMNETFGSTCHGAGRLLSRHAATKKESGYQVQQELADKGILVKAASRGTLSEEAPYAYKDVADVVEAAEGAGISRRVAKMRPIGVVKG
jgi:tRNA-splicing ligase RtcB (3'-phosphate/5'-hydroxy nucleic acid ligase)